MNNILKFILIISIICKTENVELNTRQALILNQILNIYTLSNPADQLCKNHTKIYQNGLRMFEKWALQMFDSSSKLPAGILMGNLVEFGAYQQCLEIHQQTPYGLISGKHCTIHIKPDIRLLKKILEYRNISDDRFIRVYQFVKDAKFVWSLCVPHACPTEDIYNHINRIIKIFTEGLNLEILIRDKDCQTANNIDINQNNIWIICIIFLLLFLLIFVATLMDIINGPIDTQPIGFIQIFSIYWNSKQIFAKPRVKNELDCVHGIRFMSTCYVVIGHRYLMMMFFPVINSLRIMDWVLLYRSTFITGGTLCVDTFFMISGMLVAVGYFQLEKSMNWSLFYVYRFMRITPPLAVVVFFYACLMQYFGSGPLWQDMLDIIQKPCQDYWWATLLHIQNYVHPYPLCMTQTWYLTCDMQYYFLSPLILIPLKKSRLFGLIIYFIVYLISVGIAFYFAWINKYDGGVPVTNQLFSTDYFKYYYIAPHIRASTYIMGIGFGYYLHSTKNRTIKINRINLILGWSIAISLMLISLVGCHEFHREKYVFNHLEATLFITLSRPAWTLGVIWIVWACVKGYGGLINTILSSHPFRVLSRISYSIFLWHMLIQYCMSGSMKLSGYFADFNALTSAFGDLFVVIVIGFIFTVCFESPLIKLLSLSARRGMKNQIGNAKK